MRFLSVLSLLLSLAVASPALADASHGSKDEAKAMVEKAVALIKSDGIEKAVAKFQAKDGGFIDRDLYIFVLNTKGDFVAHGARPALIGKGGLAMMDPTGFPFIKAFLDVKEAGWVDYKWPDASDGNKVKGKSSYIVHSGDYFVGAGYYKND